MVGSYTPAPRIVKMLLLKYILNTLSKLSFDNRVLGHFPSVSDLLTGYRMNQGALWKPFNPSL
jgi:hypothetical protein